MGSWNEKRSHIIDRNNIESGNLINVRGSSWLKLLFYEVIIDRWFSGRRKDLMSCEYLSEIFPNKNESRLGVTILEWNYYDRRRDIVKDDT